MDWFDCKTCGDSSGMMTLQELEDALDKLRCKKCGRCCEAPGCPPDKNGICKCCKKLNEKHP